MRRTIPFIATLAVLLVAGPAAADITNTIVHDCSHSATGYLTGTYTRAQLNEALHNLPADAREYTGCYDQIKQALRDAAGDGGSGGDASDGDDGSSGGGTIGGGAGDGTNGGGPSGSPSGTPATPHVGAREAVEIGGAAVRPGTIPAIGQDAHTLPTPLAVFLVLLGLGALVPTVATIARRVIARRRA